MAEEGQTQHTTTTQRFNRLKIFGRVNNTRRETRNLFGQQQTVHAIIYLTKMAFFFCKKERNPDRKTSDNMQNSVFFFAFFRDRKKSVTNQQLLQAGLLLLLRIVYVCQYPHREIEREKEYKEENKVAEKEKGKPNLNY